MTPQLATLPNGLQLERHGDEVNVQVTPSGGWQPDERKWSVRLMYRLVLAFTEWPKTYRWTATLDVSEVEHISMETVEEVLYNVDVRAYIRAKGL